jgi:ATP-binding cassette subfamily B protein
MRDLLEKLIANFQPGVTRTLWLIGWLFVASNLLWLAFDMTFDLFETRAMRDIDQRSFNAIQSQSMRFFESSFAGSLVTAARRFRNSFEGMADTFVYNLGRGITMIILTAAVFVWERPLLALAFGVWIIAFITISFWFAKLRMGPYTVAAAKDSIVGGAFADSFSNQATVKSFGKERDEQKRFDGVAEDCYQHKKRAYLFGSFLMRAQTVITSIFEVCVVIMLVRGWRNGTVTAADFIFFQTYIIVLIYQVWDIGAALHRIFRNLADAKEMAEIYAKKSEVQDDITARPLNVEVGEIEFHAVNFSYIDRETREYHDVNDFTLHVSPGQSIALVGHSGAGKSTLVKLLLRYFDLNSGYIRIDRQDIANVTQVSLRQQIAVVPQQPDLFHRSLYDNIAFARPDASEAEIIAAAKRAHAWEFIRRLPDGLNTLVGERGVKLSGGERQRIALARAFLADAPILVLDEATSALDSKTERQIQSAITDLLKGRTCIVIAHRLSTIQSADRIIVMENGSITEAGTHHELLSQSGVYADLWAHQSGGYIKE